MSAETPEEEIKEVHETLTHLDHDLPTYYESYENLSGVEESLRRKLGLEAISEVINK